MSVIGGVAYLSAAVRGNPKLGLLAIYAATGGMEPIIQAWLLARRHRRGYIALARSREQVEYMVDASRAASTSMS